MKDILGTTGLILNEPLLWEKGKPGRRGFSLPARDVELSPIEESLTSHGPDFPDLSEVDVVRHFTRLSTWNCTPMCHPLAPTALRTPTSRTRSLNDAN